MTGKLTDLFDFLEPGEKEQLSFLNIEKININKKTSRLDIYLSGGEFLSEENLLALAEYKSGACRILSSANCRSKTTSIAR